ncbi:putative WD repeat-containing protein C3H5.08c [Ceratocystis lukuohia]|uniref:WD repeat-containing protein C3H5.08c n=1 Tax=Ceratocystis lukuohia TaxID=2019550 RepID=A0ABR4MJL7_9PEZI
MSTRADTRRTSLIFPFGSKDKDKDKDREGEGASRSGLARSNTVVLAKPDDKRATAGAGAGNSSSAATPGASVAVRDAPSVSTTSVTNSGLDPLSEVTPRSHTHSRSPSGSAARPQSISFSSHHASRLSRNTARSKPPSLGSVVANPDLTTRSQASGTGDGIISAVTATAAPIASSGVFTETSKEKNSLCLSLRRSSSFFNRLGMIGNRHKEDSVGDGETSDSGDHRIEGARILMSPDASGFIPHHKEPAKYQRIKSNCKRHKEFGNLFLAQELSAARDAAVNLEAARGPIGSNGGGISASKTGATVAAGATVKPARPELTSHDGAVWCMEFSQDGKYLAAAGQDGIVRVYAVLASPEDRYSEEDSTPDPSHGERLRAPVFRSRPVREFAGHEGEVLDLTWSKNGFLLSSSMDKTVRLWHLDYRESLCVFKHRDFVTSISFHPRDDRFFLAGSLDCILRLWSIPDKAVAFSATVPDMITAVSFSPDGQTSIAGMLHGLCMFFETEGLKLQKEMHVRSSRGRNAKGSKITGIETLETPSYHDGGVKVLITSNDSRIRQYNMRDKSLDIKLKGHENVSSQIHSRLSEDGQFVICGSEDKRVFIWPTNLNEGDAKDKRPLEYFEAHDDVVTVAMFAPTSTRRLVGSSDDPIYDLCNPPPIRLMSREEASASQTSLSQPSSTRRMKPEESPAYIARSAHNDGNIIVSSDKSGIIRVWRQDCAATKRRHENLSAQRLSTLTRTGSIMTRTSFASSSPYSRRGSVSHLGAAAAASAGGAGAVGDGSAEKPVQLNSDIIDSWRQGVVDSPDALGSTGPGHAVEPPRTPTNLGHLGQAQALTPPSSDKAQHCESAIDDSPPYRRGAVPGPELSPPIVELSDDGEAPEKQTETEGQEGFIESFLNRWRGRSAPTVSSVAAAAMAAVTNGNTRTNSTENINVPATAEEAPQPGTAVTFAIEPLRSPTPTTPTVGVQRPSLEENRRFDDDDLAGTTPTPSNIHLLSPKARAKRRHSVGPRALTDTYIDRTSSKAHDLALPSLDPRPKSAHGVGSGAVPAIAIIDENAELQQEDQDETDGNETLGSSCAGCGRRDFYMRKIGGRPRLLCSGCGMLVSESQQF